MVLGWAPLMAASYRGSWTDPKFSLCVKQIMAIFVSTLYDKNGPSYSNFDIWPTFVPGWRYRWRHEYVTHNLHNYPSPPILLQNIVCVASVSNTQLNRPDKHRDNHTNTKKPLTHRTKTLSPRHGPQYITLRSTSTWTVSTLRSTRRFSNHQKQRISTRYDWF